MEFVFAPVVKVLMQLGVFVCFCSSEECIANYRFFFGFVML